MSWLARIDLDSSALARARIPDAYAWHQRLWECFPGEPDAGRKFLTRIDQLEGMVRAWVLAEVEPICPAWCPQEAFAVRQVAPSFLSHRRFAFDLRANPTKAVVQRMADGSPRRKANGKRASGKRIPIVDPEELHAWLVRKGRDGGFRISDEAPIEIGPMVESHFRKREMAGYHGGVHFRGIFDVVDPTQFAETYRKGIGTAKAFGFGLLLLSPLHH